MPSVCVSGQQSMERMQDKDVKAMLENQGGMAEDLFGMIDIAMGQAEEEIMAKMRREVEQFEKRVFSKINVGISRLGAEQELIKIKQEEISQSLRNQRKELEININRSLSSSSIFKTAGGEPKPAITYYQRAKFAAIVPKYNGDPQEYNAFVRNVNRVLDDGENLREVDKLDLLNIMLTDRVKASLSGYTYMSSSIFEEAMAMLEDKYRQERLTE